jgi:hypothetical protein
MRCGRWLQSMKSLYAGPHSDTVLCRKPALCDGYTLSKDTIGHRGMNGPSLYIHLSALARSSGVTIECSSSAKKPGRQCLARFSQLFYGLLNRQGSLLLHTRSLQVSGMWPTTACNHPLTMVPQEI